MRKNLSKIILTLVLIALAIYFIYPTYKDYKLKEELSKLSGQDSIDFVDKNAQELREVQENRIKLGLDLKGGMYVVMDVDVVKLLNDLAVRKDPQLEQILNEIRASNLDTDEPVVDILKQKLTEKGLTLKTYYGEIRDSEDEVEGKLNQEIDGAIERAVEVVRNRVDQYGVAEPQIQKVGGNRIIVELPGVSNPEDVRQLLQGTALLEFKLVYDPQKTVEVMQKVNAVLAGDSTINSPDTTNASLLEETILKDTARELTEDTIKQDNTSASNKDTTKKTTDTTKKTQDTTKKTDTTKKGDTSGSTDTGMTTDTTQMTQEEFMQKNPLFFTIAGINPESGEADAYVLESDKAKVDRLLNREDVKAVIPDDMQFVWSNRTYPSPETGELVYTLIAVKKQPELTGKAVVDAQANIDPTSNTPVVNMQMDSEGAADWARITGANINKRCAIVLDNVVYSAPFIRNKITGGSSVIEGMADVQEANLLAIVLKAGALPAPLKIIEERSIGPSLGEDSIRAGITSSVAALIIVALFMIVYYRVGGSVADLAVLINVLFVLGIMASFKATLTLPGIAGLILSLGMAVDTNVLIFERIREELGLGKPMKTAIDVGYKKAFSAILDSHITSFITGIILYQFGTGPIQGFALTLIFGLAANLFTAIVITHFIFDIFQERGWKFNFG